MMFAMHIAGRFRFRLRKATPALLLLVGMLLWLPDALAQVTPQAPTPGQACARNSGGGNSINYYLLKCIDERTKELGTYMIQNLTAGLAPVTTPLATLAIFFLAMKIALGSSTRKSIGSTMALAFRILIIYWLTSASAGPLIGYMRTAMEASAEVATLVFDAAETRLGSLQGQPLCQGTEPAETGLPIIAYRFDCMFDRLVGMRGAGDYLKAAGLGVLLTGLFFLGPFCAAIGIAGVTMVLLYFAAMFQILLYIVTIQVSLALLFGIAPVVLPFWLFTPTRKVVVIWFNNVIAYLLLPGIIAAYLMMMQLVFQGPISQFYGPNGIYSNLNLTDRDILESFITADTRYDEKSATGAVLAGISESVGDLTNNLLSSDLDVINKCTGGNNAGFVTGALNCIIDAGKFMLDTTTGAVVDIAKAANKDFERMRKYALQKLALAAVKGRVMVKVLRVTPELIMRFLALALVNIILLSLMISYLRRMLEDVSTMVSKSAMGIVRPNMDGVAGVERVVQGTMQGAASFSRGYGKNV